MCLDSKHGKWYFRVSKLLGPWNIRQIKFSWNKRIFPSNPKLMIKKLEKLRESLDKQDASYIEAFGKRLGNHSKRDRETEILWKTKIELSYSVLSIFGLAYQELSVNSDWIFTQRDPLQHHDESFTFHLPGVVLEFFQNNDLQVLLTLFVNFWIATFAKPSFPSVFNLVWLFFSRPFSSGHFSFYPPDVCVPS